MKSEEEWLHQYRSRRCEASFRRLVEANLGFVLSVAQRVLRNPDLARDVAQEVFVGLARSPEKVGANIPLAAWLHRTTRSLAIDTVRSEECRKRHELTAADLDAMKEPPLDWSRLSPEIDRALDKLPRDERAAVVLRFFKNQSHSQIGQALGIGSDAARMRVKRSLDRLRKILSKRGITVTAAALATALPAHASVAVPAGLSATITTTALASAAPTATGVFTLAALLTMNIKTLFVSSACLALIALSVWQRQEIVAAKNRIAESHPTLSSSTHSANSGNRGSRSLAGQSAAGERISPLLKEAIELAAIEPLASREAALLQWVTQFGTTAEILAVAEEFRETEHLSRLLRTRLASKLTTHWAKIDPKGAMEAQAASALMGESSPFGPVNLRNGHDRHGFDYIAMANPEVFEAWIKSNQPAVLDILTGGWDSDSARSLVQDSGRGEGLAPLGKSLSADSAANLALLRHAPLAMLDVFSESKMLDAVQFDAKTLSQALVAKVNPPQEIWNQLDAERRRMLDPLVLTILADTIAQADPRPSSEILAELQADDADWSKRFRFGEVSNLLAEELQSLPKGDSVAEENWWATLESFGEAINEISGERDGEFDHTYADVAALVAPLDSEAALEWAKEITSPEARLEAAGQVALRANGIENVTLLRARQGDRAQVRFFERGDRPGEPMVGLGRSIDIPVGSSVEEVFRRTDDELRNLEPGDLATRFYGEGAANRPPSTRFHFHHTIQSVIEQRR